MTLRPLCIVTFVFPSLSSPLEMLWSIRWREAAAYALEPAVGADAALDQLLCSGNERENSCRHWCPWADTRRDSFDCRALIRADHIPSTQRVEGRHLFERLLSPATAGELRMSESRITLSNP